jgi:hypothetical protein
VFGWYCLCFCVCDVIHIRQLVECANAFLGYVPRRISLSGSFEKYRLGYIGGDRQYYSCSTTGNNCFDGAVHGSITGGECVTLKYNFFGFCGTVTLNHLLAENFNEN